MIVKCRNLASLSPIAGSCYHRQSFDEANPIVNDGLHRRAWRWIRFGVVGCLAIFALTLGCQTRKASSEVLKEAEAAFKRGKFRETRQLCDQVLSQDPHSTPALILAGLSAARQQQPQAALDLLARLPETGGADVATAWHTAAEIALQLGRATDAEAYLRRALKIDPERLPSNVQMAYLLGFEGRCWEAIPYLMTSVRHRDFTFHHLVLLGATEPVIADADLMARCLSVPGQVLPLIAQARTALQQNHPADAETLLRTVITAAPESVEAHASLGRVLIASRPEAVPEWQAALPKLADTHPDVWSVRGEWAQLNGQTQAAIRCFWEAVRRNPNHRSANFHLGQLLTTSNEFESARPFIERADRLRDLVHLVDRLYLETDKTATFHRAAELTESLGRLWEAWAWSKIALDEGSERDWATANLARLQAELRDDLPQTLTSANPALAVDLSSHRLPEWPSRPKELPHVATGKSSSSQVHFEDVAARVGLEFTYYNRLDLKLDGMQMLETTGGGVAVLDYDGNGTPDVYFTQGGTWPPEAAQHEVLDQFFRNRGDGTFDHMTESAGLRDDRYSQGIAAGDYDNDGFPDLYVANIGENRLYHNNGDGTFSDVSQSAGIRGELWTTSCLIADLNGDALPDLYDVNYLSAKAAATQICRKGDEIRWCSPDAFDAEQDQVYLNLGDGRFQNVTDSAGIVTPNGKGMGIVAADFDNSGRLSLFIGNDAVANFLFVNQTRQRGDAIKFSEQAVPAGLAFDRDGLPQACMGIAAGDANGDGLFDLFVTNFEDQSNTLYQQLADFSFEDVTRRVGLRDPSFAMLGFGTQFIDGELDGWPDLVLTNGHVLDLSYKGAPYEMAPQYFRNLGAGQFEEVPADWLGPFFRRKTLGRGLARLDWNRDGREDFVVSHMNSPAALVENQTQTAGHYLTVELRGVQSARDAIGTIVQVKCGDRSWTKQLTGGDGYQATNQRQLVFGLGDSVIVDELTVRWPASSIQIFRKLPVDQDVIVIEGQSAILDL